jgi:hypothetical protein
MLFLWIFGDNVEATMSHSRFFCVLSRLWSFGGHHSGFNEPWINATDGRREWSDLGSAPRLLSPTPTGPPPRLVVSGRITYFLSTFGEHLRGEEVESAVAADSQGVGLSVADFSVGTLMAARGNNLGAHLYLVEFVPSPPTEEQRSTFA